MIEDGELLRRWSEQGQQDAFAELVRRHLPLVYNLALRGLGGDAHLAKDVSQQVFISLERKAASLAQHPSIVGWLLTATHFAATQLVRSEQRRRARENAAFPMNESFHSPESLPADERLRPVLDELVQSLNPTERTALVLRFYQGRTFQDTGRLLRVTEEGARSRVNRALEKIRLRMERRGISSSGVLIASLLAGQAQASVPAGLASSILHGTVLAGAATGTGIAAFFTMTSTKLVLSGGVALALLAAIGVGLRDDPVTVPAEPTIAISPARPVPAEVVQPLVTTVSGTPWREGGEPVASTVAAELQPAPEPVLAEAAPVSLLDMPAPDTMLPFIQLPNADFDTFVSTLSIFMGRDRLRVEIDPEPSGVFNFVSATPISKRDAVRAMLTLLELNGLAARPGGRRELVISRIAPAAIAFPASN